MTWHRGGGVGELCFRPFLALCLMQQLLYAMDLYHMFSHVVGRNGWKNTFALLPHVAEDEIASSDDDSSDSEESDTEVEVVRVLAPRVVEGEIRVDESDVYQLTDEQVLQRPAEACKAADPSPDAWPLSGQLDVISVQWSGLFVGVRSIRRGGV